MRPARIQLRRTRGFNLKSASEALNGLPCVKVDRSTRWGNPWTAAAFDDPVAEYRASVHSAAADGGGIVPPIGEIIHHLRGKNLGCWCHLCPAHAAGKPLGVQCDDCAPCHADVQLELANAPRPHSPPQDG